MQDFDPFSPSCVPQVHVSVITLLVVGNWDTRKFLLTLLATLLVMIARHSSRSSSYITELLGHIPSFSLLHQNLVHAHDKRCRLLLPFLSTNLARPLILLPCLDRFCLP